ncbi:hypothetical protein U14_04593 [Candidatus Moduliflexus flocculans]|uniref:DUF433 domain-containing protein n=1 Tax=Candidatus Moduliflexus flocculans TaxID=1499966 RepID=A0A0S6W0W4_9BACT|nr:hypothetical protein U14_04593 [Candidatus Moduliflexus flocculans]
MDDSRLLERIVANPHVMAGKPVIQGTRLTVEYILGLFAHGATVNDVLAEYDGMNEDDIRACFLFAARSLESTFFMPLTMETA